MPSVNGRAHAESATATRAATTMLEWRGNNPWKGGKRIQARRAGSEACRQQKKRSWREAKTSDSSVSVFYRPVPVAVVVPVVVLVVVVVLTATTPLSSSLPA